MSATLAMTLGTLRTEDQAREIDAQGEEAVSFALLASACGIAVTSTTRRPTLRAASGWPADCRN